MESNLNTLLDRVDDHVLSKIFRRDAVLLQTQDEIYELRHTKLQHLIVIYILRLMLFAVKVVVKDVGLLLKIVYDLINRDHNRISVDDEKKLKLKKINV
jgi:hypothetical protein